MNSLWLLLACVLGACLAEWNEHMENPGMYEGDMILTPEQMSAIKNGFAGTSKRWPNGVIPYRLSSQIARNSRAMSAINAAIASYNRNTCISFVKRTTERVYLDIFVGGGCYSFVGYSGQTYKLSLADGCWSKGTVIHEFMHAAGFYHEQSRRDRDSYIRVMWNNIAQNMQSNFQKQTGSIDYGSSYDYRSIMHYRKTAFGGGRVTMVTTDRNMQNVIGTSTDFSSADIKQLNAMYQCGGTRPNTPRPNTPRPGGSCTDKVVDCRRNLHRCNDRYSSTWREYMRRHCRKSCGFCSAGK